MISILNKKIYFLLLTFLLLVTILPINVKATSKNLVNIYFFYSNDCTHCHNESTFLDSLEEKYENIKIYRYEIHNETNNNLRLKIQNLYNIKNSGVPLTIIGDTSYIGYSEERSNLTFIKTIEYYSKYGYIDQVGNILGLEEVKNNNPTPGAPTLKTFLDTYGNYKLIGSLTTDNLDPTSNAIILGVLSQFNLIKIIALIIGLLILLKSEAPIVSLTYYLTLSMILNTTYTINNNIYKIVVIILILVSFILNIIKYTKTRKTKYLILNVLTIIAFTSSYLENQNYATYAAIFNNLIKLHNLDGLNKLSYYGNYFFIIIIINLSLLLIFYGLNNKKINFDKKF